MAALAVMASMGSACGGEVSRAEDPAPAVDELARHDGRVCPEKLPRDPGQEFAFGTDEPARERPSPGEFDRAWICVYELPDARKSWIAAHRPVEVRADDLAYVRAQLDELVPAENEACTADLGRLYLFVTLRDAKDLTGYAIDDFGCRNVRVTDDPFEGVPGDAEQPGTVRGILTGGRDLVALAEQYAD